MSDGLTFEIRYIIFRNFQGCWDLNRKWPLQNLSRYRIDGEIAENHAILVNLTASYIMLYNLLCNML